MRTAFKFKLFLLLVLILFADCKKSENLSGLSGPYLGQKPPGLKPEIFAPGVVSTEAVELNSIFTPEGDEFYFTRKDSTGLYKIMQMKLKRRKWTIPECAPFSGVYEEADPFISPDGRLFFYITKKPDKTFGPPHDILIMEKTKTGWSEPVNPGPPLNTEYNEIYPSISSNGVLYFNSDLPGGLGKRDIYKCNYNNGKFTQPKNVGKPVSSEFNEGDVFIAPDESYLIFVSVNRPGGFGSGDLYICFKNSNGTWSESVNMGEDINSEGYDYGPIVTFDGKYFFFTKHNDIYWVSTEKFEMFKAKNNE